MTTAVAVAAAKTSTGNQDITTTALSGATPKAVLFLYSRAAANGAITADGGESYGVATATDQRCGAAASAVAPVVVHSLASQDTITTVDMFGVVNCVATFTSFDSDGFTLNFSTPAPEPTIWGVFTILDAGASVTPNERLFGTLID